MIKKKRIIVITILTLLLLSIFLFFIFNIDRENNKRTNKKQDYETLLHKKYKYSNLLVTKYNDFNNPLIDYRSKDNTYVSTSESKIFLIEKVLEQLDKKYISWDKDIKYSPEVMSDDAKLEVKQSYKLDELVKRAIIESNNSATNLLINSLFEGIDNYSDIIKDDYPKVNMNTYYSRPPYVKKRQSNIFDVAHALSYIYKSNSSNASKIKNYLHTEYWNSGFNIKGAQGGKIGNLNDSLTYICLVEKNKHKYILAVSFNENKFGRKLDGNNIKNYEIINNLFNEIHNKKLQ